jgi:peptide/nickel transport system substrate-binding protein
MARRIRWQILIAASSAALVLSLMSYLALTTAAVAKPLAGGAYVDVESAPPTQLNPLVSDPLSDPTAANFRVLLFDGLMRIGDDGLPEPALARTWPEVDESGTSYTFTLRQDVRWHDDTPFSADDVLFTIRSIQSPGFVGDQLTGTIWRNVVLEEIDEYSFRATLPVPFAPFLSLATFPILPAHILRDVPPEQWATSSFNQKPVGTGPYLLTEINGERALLIANQNYYQGKPYLNTIELRFQQDRQPALAALSRGEAIGFGVSSTNELSRVNVPRTAVRHAVPLDAYTTLTFNIRQAPLSDQALRRALALGLDKTALIQQVLDGQGLAVDTPVLNGWWAKSQEVRWYVYDTQAAADTLTSLGYEVGPDGVRVREGQALALSLLTDNAPDRVAAAREIARQWSELGVNVDIEQVDAATLDQRLKSRQFTMALHGWQRQGPDPDIMYELWHSDGAEDGANYAGLQDEEIDRQLAAARQNADLAARFAAYETFQQRWVELAPSITLYQPLFLYTATSQLGGLDLEAQENTAGSIPPRPLLLGREDRFRNINRWFINSGREIHGELRQAP